MKNQDEIKTVLNQLYPCKTSFTVVQTGKTSSKINGLYNPANQEIVLYDKNFTTYNQLMYTAIHELTHHILITEKDVKTQKSHFGIFWATFYDLRDKAIELGFYTRERSEETASLTAEAVEIQKKISEAQNQLGKILSELYRSCEKSSERVEDVINHDLQMTRNKAKALIRNAAEDTKHNDELAKAINLAKDPMIKHAAQTAADSGKTVEQVKAIAKQKPKATDSDLESPKQLLKEKKRIESAINRLNDRLMCINQSLRRISP